MWFRWFQKERIGSVFLIIRCESALRKLPYSDPLCHRVEPSLPFARFPIPYARTTSLLLSWCRGSTESQWRNNKARWLQCCATLHSIFAVIFHKERSGPSENETKWLMVGIATHTSDETINPVTSSSESPGLHPSFSLTITSNNTARVPMHGNHTSNLIRRTMLCPRVRPSTGPCRHQAQAGVEDSSNNTIPRAWAQHTRLDWALQHKNMGDYLCLKHA